MNKDKHIHTSVCVRLYMLPVRESHTNFTLSQCVCARTRVGSVSGSINYQYDDVTLCMMMWQIVFPEYQDDDVTLCMMMWQVVFPEYQAVNTYTASPNPQKFRADSARRRIKYAVYKTCTPCPLHPHPFSSAFYCHLSTTSFMALNKAKPCSYWYQTRQTNTGFPWTSNRRFWPLPRPWPWPSFI